MGKIRRERQKYHLAAEKKDAVQSEKDGSLKCKPLKLQLDSVQNIFAGINIQLSDINKFEEHSTSQNEPIGNKEENIKSDQRSVATADAVKPDPETGSKTLKKQITKKEKMMLKHQKLMQKLDVTQQARLQHKKQKSQKKGHSQILEESKTKSHLMLTPAAIKPSNQNAVTNSETTAPKNVFAIPTFNDDLPVISSVFARKGNKNQNLHKKSKSIAKSGYKKTNFVKNCSFLRKAMTKKK